MATGGGNPGSLVRVGTEAAGTNPVLLLIDLLTRTTDLNPNEQEQLTKLRGADFTNKPEYESLLQQVIQQQATGAIKP